MKRTNGYGSLLGAGALGGAAIVLGVATLSAISGDTVSTEAPVVPATGVASAEISTGPTVGALTALPIEGSASVQWEDVQLATELAPFEEDRVWTGARYQLPGEQVVFQTVEAPPQRELEPPPAFEVLGTATSGGSGLAVIRIGAGTPMLVATGQRIEGYEVASIDGGRVTMRNAERSLSLNVASASPTGPAVERNTRQGQTRNQGNGGNRGNANAARPAGTAPARTVRVSGSAANAAELARTLPPGTTIEMNGNEVVVSGANGQQLIRMERPAGVAPAEGQAQFRWEAAGIQMQGQPPQRGR